MELKLFYRFVKKNMRIAIYNKENNYPTTLVKEIEGEVKGNVFHVKKESLGVVKFDKETMVLICMVRNENGTIFRELPN